MTLILHILKGVWMRVPFSSLSLQAYSGLNGIFKELMTRSFKKSTYKELELKKN
jgi:hypothetical protein